MSKMILIEEAKLTSVLEALVQWETGCGTTEYLAKVENVVHFIREALASAAKEQPAQDNTYGYAKYLAEAMFKRHFASDEHYASGRVVWGVNDTVIGILTQIDNMVADMVRRPAQQEPVDFASLLREAEEIVREKPTWKRFIDGTPLANDIAVWMTVFAQDVARHASPPAQPARKPLTREQVKDLLFEAGYVGAEESADFINGLRHGEAAHGIKGDA